MVTPLRDTLALGLVLFLTVPLAVAQVPMPTEVQESEDIVELGRLPRRAIVDTDVVDADGSHIPEPLHESFESPGLSLAVLRWSNEGVDEEERFAFRSVWLAWKAARKPTLKNSPFHGATESGWDNPPPGSCA